MPAPAAPISCGWPRAGFAYSWDEPYAVYFAYRLLDTDYQNDTFAYDMRQAGFMIGFGFRL